MARKSIKTNYYLFDASEREVVIPGGIQREQLILITNVTDNKVIYNFSDPELTATEYHISTDIRNVVTTRVVLAYDTTSMADTDKLQIVYDDFEETVKPAETYMDSVNKQRISTPQSQIDTDFEYGTQSTKWEALAMINNNPFAYKSDVPLAITQMEAFQGSKSIRVSVNTLETPLPASGTAIFVQDTIHDGANGVFIVDSVNNGANQFNYTARYAWASGDSDIDVDSRTAVYTGIHYTGSDIGGSITLSAPGDGQVRVVTSNAHGLEVGNEFAIVGSAGNNVNGSWIVATVESPTVFEYYPSTAPSGSVNNGTIKLYPRPQGTSIHRAFDGGVKFSTNSFSKNQQAIRQTKRYFRYQSGKGVAFSTGSILAPAIENVDEITSSGSTVTVTCAVAHNLSRDTVVKVQGCNDNVYNGDFQVVNVIDAYKFQYTAASAPSESTASGQYTVTPVGANGVNLEIGMMDQQNGLFFRHANGHTSVVRRTSTFQLSGKATVTSGSSLVSSYTGPNQQGTKFAKQLKPGDYVVLRGSSYRVDGIISDTQMVIFPDYRGPSAINVPITKTVETEWDQSEWNLDRCDGTGKSGYTLDVTKMQMFYMDYSWYGAGFIRWGFRGEDGDVIYAHKVPNNNLNTEAYMRSGNLPARYEVNTICPKATITKSFSSSDTTVYVDKAPYGFPDAGTLRIRQTTSATAANVEYVNYTGTIKFQQDVISTVSSNDSIVVSSTTGLQGNGVQPITFDRPFSNIVAEKVYYVAQVLSSTAFTITDTAGQSTAISLNDEVGSILSPLGIALSGGFTGLTREQAGALAGGVTLTISNGQSSGSASSSTGIQKGQRVVGSDVPSDTFVHAINGANIQLSKAVTANNPTGVKFPPLGTGAASAFTYNATQPISAELIQATSTPSISHWGSSVIMEGRYDDDRAYVYTYGTSSGEKVGPDEIRSLLALRLAPSVDNGITGDFGTRELVNRMQLVLNSCEVNSEGEFFVELVLNPRVSFDATWIGMNEQGGKLDGAGGTSLAQFCDFTTQGLQGGKIGAQVFGGEVIYGFYAGAGVSSYDLSKVKEISNSILGGGTDVFSSAQPPNPNGMFPDGPEVLAFRVKNITVGSGQNDKAIDIRISWTEAQA
jgi:hypothetical protein